MISALISINKCFLQTEQCCTIYLTCQPVFEIIRDTTKMNNLSKFDKDWIKIMGCRVVTTKLLTTQDARHTTDIQGSQKLTLSRFNTYEITSRHRTTVFSLHISSVIDVWAT